VPLWVVTVGERLKQARQAALPKMSAAAFADEVNRRLPGTDFSRETIANMENNRRSVPEDVVRIASNLFRKPMAWFYEGVAAYEPLPPELDYPKVVSPDLSVPVRIAPVGKVEMRVAGTVPAGSDWGDPLQSEWTEFMDAKFGGHGRFLAKVRGDSCFPALLQGDMAVWEADESPRVGTLVLVEETDEYRVTVKELVLEPSGRLSLRAVNRDSDVPSLTQPWRVTAKLVGVERRQPGMPEITLYDPDGLTPAQLIPFSGYQVVKPESIPSTAHVGEPTLERAT